MGGLRKRMPFTFLVTWIGTLALAAIPPVSGFWSKDAIFAATYDRPGLAACSMLAGFFTSFFMLRMILVAFDGNPARKTRSTPTKARRSWWCQC